MKYIYIIMAIGVILWVIAIGRSSGKRNIGVFILYLIWPLTTFAIGCYFFFGGIIEKDDYHL